MNTKLLILLFFFTYSLCLPLVCIGQNDGELVKKETSRQKKEDQGGQKSDSKEITIERTKRGKEIDVPNAIKISPKGTKKAITIKRGNKFKSTSSIAIRGNFVKFISASLTAKEIILECSKVKIKGTVILRAKDFISADSGQPLVIVGRGHIKIFAGNTQLPIPILLQGGGVSISFVNK